jgi:hypothetical protein
MSDSQMVRLISSLVKISEIDNHQQKPTEHQHFSPDDGNAPFRGQ